MRTSTNQNTEVTFETTVMPRPDDSAMSRRRLSVPSSAYFAACCDVSLLVQETGCSATSPISDLVIKHCLKGGAVKKVRFPESTHSTSGCFRLPGLQSLLPRPLQLHSPSSSWLTGCFRKLPSCQLHGQVGKACKALLKCSTPVQPVLEPFNPLR